MVTERKRGMRMQDRYLFRGKRIDNGEWVHGYLFDDGFENGRVFIGGIVIEKYNGTACDDWNVTGINFYEIDPNTICQCTGLKDKNGKLIFENDIVAYLDVYSTDSGLAEADSIGEVVWDDETISFQVTNRLFSESYEVLGDECSVIGNVFDNPELLEE